MFLHSSPRRTAPDTLGAIVLLAAILASAFATSPAHGKTRGGKASGRAAKVHVCESVDAYEGQISPVHPRTRLANACRDVSPSAARKAIESCAAEGDPAVCEVLFTADRSAVLIEHKILIPADDLAIASEGGAK